MMSLNRVRLWKTADAKSAEVDWKLFWTGISHANYLFTDDEPMLGNDVLETMFEEDDI